MFDVTLSLVVLRSSDIGRAAHFFGLLGIRFESEKHGSGPEHFAARLGPTVLEIYPQGSETASVGMRLGFRVASVDAVVETVLREGGEVLMPPRHGPWGYRAVLADPDGRQVEISEAEDSA